MCNSFPDLTSIIKPVPKTQIGWAAQICPDNNQRLELFITAPNTDPACFIWELLGERDLKPREVIAFLNYALNHRKVENG